MRFRIKESPKNRKAAQLAGELPDRAEAIIEQIPVFAADFLLDRIHSRAPADLVPGYPDFLSVKQYAVQGVGSVAGVVAPGWANSYRLKVSDVTRTVLFIKPKVIVPPQGVDEGAFILSRSNPWTMATLPYEPTKAEASIVSRQVSEREVTKIEQRLRSERRAGLDNRLVKAGKRIGRLDPQLLQRRVTRDIAFEVLRAEFGLGDIRSSHWRPAVRELRSTGIRGVLKRLLRWYTVPSEGRWRSPPEPAQGRPADVKRVQEFQDYVAVTGTG